ncbi:MAG TPA: SH3 domain-containing protein [Chitinophagaceae bacterium]|nr:SH3 domain-containing protein [Chitinophagaceae bacterium]
MKKILLLLLNAALSFNTVSAQNSYVAAKDGLSFREQPAITAKLITKIPYGTKLTIIQEDSEWIPVRAEGINGYWRKVKYENNTGYVADCYLIPAPPPTNTITDMPGYFSQLSKEFGKKLVIRSSPDDIEEGGWVLEKQLYENGTETHHFQGYEYGSMTYFLPEFTMQQAFLVVRLIAEFKEVFKENDNFPDSDKTFTRDGREYSIKVEKENYGGDFNWIKKVAVEFEYGAIYYFELYQVDSQVVIFLGAGV